jgi:hypothetical protein
MENAFKTRWFDLVAQWDVPLAEAWMITGSSEQWMPTRRHAFQCCALAKTRSICAEITLP